MSTWPKILSRSMLGALLGLLIACETKPRESIPAASSTTSLPPTNLRIEANDHGFSPSRVQVAANQPTRLTFRRTSDGTCATSVVFPDLHIERQLPKDQDIAVELPAMASGREFAFQCGMGMYKSKVVAQ